jgi:hypothetical protein
VPDLVLLVAVEPSLRLVEQAEAVVVPDGVHRRAGQFPEFAGAPGHVGPLPGDSRFPDPQSTPCAHHTVNAPYAPSS